MLTTILMAKVNDVIIAKTIKMIRRRIILRKRKKQTATMYNDATIKKKNGKKSIMARPVAKSLAGSLGMMIYRLPRTGVLIRYSNRLEPSCT